jgi:CRISPR-associated protein Csc3
MSNEISDENFDFLDEDYGSDEERDRTLEPTFRELLTLKLLREAVESQLWLISL